MHNHIKTKRPFTPIRQLVVDFFKSPGKSGKRSRSRSCSFDDVNIDRTPVSDSRNHIPPAAERRSAERNMISPASTRRLSLPGVAIQTEDPELGAIIITSFTAPPFCCHEDLLTMPRRQLIKTAQALNVRLPAVLQIPVGTDVSDTLMRNGIEALVGIRVSRSAILAVPPAPKPIRTRSLNIDMCMEMDAPLHQDVADDTFRPSSSPPSSPLAMRVRSHPHDTHHASSPCRLAMLKEEDEEVIAPRHRPSKRQRVVVDDTKETTGGIKQRRRSARLRVRNMPPSPTPATRSDNICIARAISQRDPSTAKSSPQTRLLRSQSQKMPAEQKFKVDTSFITFTRPKYRFRRQESGAKAENRISVETAKHSVQARSSSDRAPVTGHSVPVGFLGKAGLRRETRANASNVDMDVTCGLQEMSLGASKRKPPPSIS